MRNKIAVLVLAAAGTACGIASLQPVRVEVSQPEARNVELAGLTWHGSLETALAVAKREGKPVLHLQMFGKLDDAFC